MVKHLDRNRRRKTKKKVRARTIPTVVAAMAACAWYCVCCGQVFATPAGALAPLLPPNEVSLMPGCEQYDLRSKFRHLGCEHPLERRPPNAKPESVAMVAPVPVGWSPHTALRHPLYPHDFAVVAWPDGQDVPVHLQLHARAIWSAHGVRKNLEPPLSVLPLPSTVHAHHINFPATTTTTGPPPCTDFPWSALPSSIRLQVPAPGGPRCLVTPLPRPVDLATPGVFSSSEGLIADTGLPLLEVWATVLAIDAGGHVRRWTIQCSANGFVVWYYPDVDVAPMLGTREIPSVPDGHLYVYAVVDVETVNPIHGHPVTCGDVRAAVYTGVRSFYPGPVQPRLTRVDLQAQAAVVLPEVDDAYLSMAPVDALVDSLHVDQLVDVSLAPSTTIVDEVPPEPSTAVVDEPPPESGMDALAAVPVSLAPSTAVVDVPAGPSAAVVDELPPTPVPEPRVAAPCATYLLFDDDNDSKPPPPSRKRATNDYAATPPEKKRKKTTLFMKVSGHRKDK
jgi:hypothetical protein